MVRMQKSLCAAAFVAWMSLEPALVSYEPVSKMVENKEEEEEKEEEEDEEGFISFLQKSIVATMEATKEISLKGVF
jgi:hypothetical protein